MARIRRWSVMVVVLFAVALLPIPAADANITVQQPDVVPPQPPPLPKAAPFIDQRLPSLSVNVTTADETINLGGTTTISVTVTNLAPDPAYTVAISLPLPAGAEAVSTDRFVSPTVGWQWSIGQLAGGQSTTVHAEVRLASQPPGDALLARASVTARGFSEPFRASGGAIVRNDDADATAAFAPGRAVTLRSRDGRVSVSLPSRAAASELALRQAWSPPPGEPTPPALVGHKRGFGTFYLNATNTRKQPLHRFDAPLTIAVHYTPEQLEVLGIAEPNLSLFWFDEQAGADGTGAWVLVPGTVDVATQTVTATVDHFSAFAIGDGLSPSAAFIPSLQGWQVGLYTGGVAYSYPIEVPAGPNGIKPDLQLAYNSNATDGDTGRTALLQAGWVGKGWSLNTGSVALNKLPFNHGNTYSLVVNGISANLVRGAALAGNTGPNDSNPSHWEWRPTDETFMRVRAVDVGPSTATVGGRQNSNVQQRYKWLVWTKDGMRYGFAEDRWWGFENCGATGTMEAYKWELKTVTDPFGNQITYNYNRMATTLTDDEDGCISRIDGTVDTDSWPTSITWGGDLHAVPPTPDRFKVEFLSNARGCDTAFDGSDNQFGGPSRAPHETRQLDMIKVLNTVTNPPELIRQYNFVYASCSEDNQQSVLSDASVDNTSGDTRYPKLTLREIQRVGNDGTVHPGITRLTYHMARGTRFYPNGGWNRLATVDNGQGGKIEFEYDNIGQVLDPGQTASRKEFINNHRVKTKKVHDGRGNSYTWVYNYGTPAYNSLGSVLDARSPQRFPNSAVLYGNSMDIPDPENTPSGRRHILLFAKPFKEFRGHGSAIVIDPNGNQNEQWFHQGSANCEPRYVAGQPRAGQLVSGADIWKETATVDNNCFLNMRKNEFLKGCVYKQELRGPASAGSPLLVGSEQSYDVRFLDYGPNRMIDLWRAWSAQS